MTKTEINDLTTPELLTAGLGFPEGPTILPDGRVCFVESFLSRVSVWSPEKGVESYSYTAGAPNSSVLGAKGELYICQNGGTIGPWRAKEMIAPSIQRIDHEGADAEIIMTEIEGIKFNGPNDLVFGENGTLYFTDPGTYNPSNPDPSYIFAIDPNGIGKLIAHLDPPSFPNGIAVEENGDVIWAESYTGMVRRYLTKNGKIEDIARIPGEKPVADGMTVGVDGRIFITTVNGGGIDVIHHDGRYDQFISLGKIPTNCTFHGSDLYMTDAGVLANTTNASFDGQLWRLKNVTPGCPTHYGSISTTR